MILLTVAYWPDTKAKACGSSGSLLVGVKQQCWGFRSFFGPKEQKNPKYSKTSRFKTPFTTIKVENKQTGFFVRPKILQSKWTKPEIHN